MTASDTIRKTCAFLAPVIVLTCVVACAFAQSAGDRTAPITAALHNQEFGQALELLQKALRESPGNPQLWTLQGVAYAGEKHPQEALSSLHHALQISPDYLPALENAAQLEFEAGSSAAVPLLQHVLRLRPGDTASHAMLAVLAYRHGRCDSAVIHFEKAGTLLDSQLGALHAYATCLVRLRQLDAAARVFQRIVVLQPDDPQERQLLAAIQLMAHKPQDAVASLDPLLQADNPDAASLDLAAAAYEDAKDTPQAISTLRRAILLDPRNVSLYLDFANISYTHNSFQVGIDVLNDGLEQLPKAAQLYLVRGVLYIQLAQYDRAEADFAKAYQLDPNQSLSAAAQGMAAADANDLDRALATIQTKLARKPDDALLLYLQADFLSQKGAVPGTPEFQLAMRSAKRAVFLQPGVAAARGVLAKLYLQAGQYPEAVEQSRKAIEIDPKDQTALYRLIQAQRKTGSQSEIPDLLKRLAQLRQQASQEERQRNRYKLVEDDAQP